MTAESVTPPSIYVPAESHLYSGTSGIGLFLLEAWRLTGDALLLRTAEGAFARAAELVDEMPPERAGFYVGRPGVAYAFARMARLTNSDQWAWEAVRVVGPLLGRETADRKFDIVVGSAGAVLCLLEVADLLDRDELRESAARFADHLVASATRGADGWSWNDGATNAARNLTGFAHGAAGIAHSLLEAYRTTGEGNYRFAAEQALAYERSAFDSAAANWPDYRSVPISQALQGGMSRLREWALSGRIPRNSVPRFMTAWCHGAGGIGPARLHAFRILGYAYLRDDACVALDAVRKFLARPTNYSLCHGATGNAEALIFARDILRDHEAGDSVMELAERAAETYERSGNAWPSGASDKAQDPSLMIGDAGIGYFDLRLASESVPSILFPTVSTQPFRPIAASAPRVRDTHRQDYFPLTLRCFRERGVTDWGQVSEGGAELEFLAEALERAITEIPYNEDPDLVRDCYALERARYRLGLVRSYRADEMVSDLTRPSVVAWDRLIIRLAHGVKLFETNGTGAIHNIQSFLPQSARVFTFCRRVAA